MSVIDRAIGIFAPHLCIACGRNGSVICSDCLGLAGSPPPPRCAGCKQLSEASKTCTSCRSWLPLSHVFVATTLDGVEERLLHAYKFEYMRSGAAQISALMMANMPEEAYDIVTWVPTAPSRVRRRGFDHARLLARHISHQIDTPYQQLLHRRSNVRQLGASRKDRLEHMKHEFTSVDTDLKGKRVLLIDDVMTTGASLAAAARMLKKMGAADVHGLIYAQKL